MAKQITNRFIGVEKVEEEVKEGGFQEVKVQDNSFYKGRIKYLPAEPVYFGDRQAIIGDIVLFAPYSPSTHDIEDIKTVAIEDLRFIL